MRCPKCGYISFDHLETCLKCKKNIKADTDGLHGTVFHVAAPAYLKLGSRQEDNSGSDEDFADDFVKDTDFVDEDLEVLVEDEVAVDDANGNDAEQDDKALAGSDEPEDREIEMDLSQFEDMDELDAQASDSRPKPVPQEEAQALSLEIPAELSDMSDLAPPPRGTQVADKAGAKKTAANLDIDGLDFDLGLGDLDNGALSGGANPAKETILALDDIDFSETLAKKSSPKPPGKAGGTDMDEDLNFDLDLGGLSIHKNPPKSGE